MNDQDIERLWRAQSTETPGERIDAVIRAAARRDLRRRPAWTRYAPLAAAASVGVIAILLVRQSPREDLTRVAPVGAPVVTEDALRDRTAAGDDSAASVPAATPRSAEAEAPPAATQSAATQATAAPAAPAARKAAAPAPEPPPVAREAAPGVQRSTEMRARIPAPAAVAAQASAVADANGEAPALPARLIELITADAAAVAEVDPQDVRILEWQAVTWSDGSLGCRTPGELAIQVLTPGYRVQVLAGALALEYHTDAHDLVRLCHRGEARGTR